MRSIQFAERYFGRYRLSPLTHHPAGSRFARISSAHPFLVIMSFAATTSGSSSGLLSNWVRARYRTDGWSSSRSQSNAFLDFISG